MDALPVDPFLVLLASAFLAASISTFLVSKAIHSGQTMRRRLEEAAHSTLSPPRSARVQAKPGGPDPEEIPLDAEPKEAAVQYDPNDPVTTYYLALKRWDSNTINNRLLKAGYWQPEAYRTFLGIRVVLGLTVCGVAFVMASILSPDATFMKKIMIALPSGGLGFVLPSMALDKVIKWRLKNFKRAFPDFIDMLVVCLEAGLTFEAAVNRISQELVGSDRLFSIHLQIVMLEVRAGRSMRLALQAFSERTEVEEARSLVSFVRQSEDLGVSIGQALRVFASEMRDRRAYLAEEKANALPTKMLLPIALFLFPVTLSMVLGPILLSLLDTFDNM